MSFHNSLVLTTGPRIEASRALASPLPDASSSIVIQIITLRVKFLGIKTEYVNNKLNNHTESHSLTSLLALENDSPLL